MLPQVTPFDSLGMAQPVLWPTVGLGSGSCLTGGCGPAELFFGVVSRNLFSVLRLQSFGALLFFLSLFAFLSSHPPCVFPLDISDGCIASHFLS